MFMIICRTVLFLCFSEFKEKSFILLPPVLKFKMCTFPFVNLDFFSNSLCSAGGARLFVISAQEGSSQLAVSIQFLAGEPDGQQPRCQGCKETPGSPLITGPLLEVLFECVELCDYLFCIVFT